VTKAGGRGEVKGKENGKREDEQEGYKKWVEEGEKGAKEG